MATPNTINLIKAKTIVTPQYEAIAKSLRRSGYIMLILFLTLGVLSGVLYVLFSAEEKNLLSQKEGYIQRIENDREMEGFFRSIKDRTRIVQSTFNSRKPWAQLLDQVNTIVAPPVLTNISVDNQNKIIVTVKAGSVDTILPIVNTLIAQTQSGRLSQPQLDSLQIAKTGIVSASFSFKAVF